jgi:hypothetical protein
MGGMARLPAALSFPAEIGALTARRSVVEYFDEHASAMIFLDFSPSSTSSAATIFFVAFDESRHLSESFSRAKKRKRFCYGTTRMQCSVPFRELAQVKFIGFNALFPSVAMIRLSPNGKHLWTSAT